MKPHIQTHISRHANHYANNPRKKGQRDIYSKQNLIKRFLFYATIIKLDLNLENNKWSTHKLKEKTKKVWF